MRSANARRFATVVQMRQPVSITHIELKLIVAIRNIAEQLIDKGLATAVRHRRDDEDRSSDYDKLMAAEQR